MDKREFKDAMYSGLAKMLKALANPARLELIDLLAQGEKSVEGLVEASKLTVANTSQHLQVLKNNNIVKSRKEKQYVFYSLSNNEFLDLYHHISRYGLSEIAELERTLVQQRTQHHSCNAVSLDELELMMDDDNVLLMDVRPAVEFGFGHITGAISLPADELKSQLCKLPRDKEIIAYCRGPFCALSDDAVELLSSKGFKVRRLDEGYPEWKLKQLETTKTE
ncbi:MAG: ArsR family transcriptional regulator [Prolixibacteraceae bacterium]|nr:ArsR family transcriptional regulator [Prolixibacteraceae bacterium]MBN2650222.1 ArsR family transcriptional regulator [Prolixibacteraceae bacterium]